MKNLLIALLLAMFTSSTALVSTAQSGPDFDKMTDAEYEAYVKDFMSKLNPQTGIVKLPHGNATLNVPEGFYYLGPKDAYKVLVDVWGNIEGLETDGMIFPADHTPFDNGGWAVDLAYEKTGYVSDDDAESIDYSKLLKDLQAETKAANIYRKQKGYEPIELVGWAANPSYDAVNHRLYWAKDLIFGEAEQHTLNYDMRVLGRRGVLSMNFISSMDELSAIEQAAPKILAMPSFEDGSRYEDFDPKVDTKSSLGIAGLIAGGVGAAAVAKKGGFIVLLAFLKKGWMLILIGLTAVGRFLTGLFKKK